MGEHDDGAVTMLTVRQVAIRLGVSNSMVYDLIVRGDLNATRVGRCYRIDPSDLADYRLRMRTRTTDDGPKAA